MLAASFLEPQARAVIWTAMLVWMGGACLANARRCGRTHCWLTGPFFILMAAGVAAYAGGLVDLGEHSWAFLAVSLRSEHSARGGPANACGAGSRVRKFGAEHLWAAATSPRAKKGAPRERRPFLIRHAAGSKLPQLRQARQGLTDLSVRHPGGGPTRG